MLAGENINKNAPGLLIDVSLSKNTRIRIGVSRGHYALSTRYGFFFAPQLRMFYK